MPHSIFKPKKRGDGGKSKEGRYWWGQYRLDGDEKYTRLSLKTTDKRIAAKKLEEIVTREERTRAGILPPERMVQAASKPLPEHLADFLAFLRTGNRSRGYIRKIEQRASSLFTQCGWRLPRDVNADCFYTWRSAQSMAPKTLNDYLDAINALMGWMVTTKRIEVNPLADAQKVDARGKKTFERRAFTDDEIVRLFEIAGPRVPIYLVAVHTGLRWSEIRFLEWADVHLDEGQLHLRAEATKARRAEVLPLSPTALELFRDLARRAGPEPRVFPGGMPSHNTFQEDLARAGIPRFDALGRKVDFHALRVTFITNLARAGAAQRVAMALARHKDPKLTANIYTDTTGLPLAQAVALLPDYGFKVQANAAHGAAQETAQDRVPGRHEVSRTDGGHGSADRPQDLDATGVCSVNEGQSVTPSDTAKKWSRGESNPRPEIVSKMLLRV